MFDVVFLHCGELCFNANLSILTKNLGFSPTVIYGGEQGVAAAHLRAAGRVTTEMFWLVDADCEVLPDFDFSYRPMPERRNTIHIWQSHNPVNGLEYENGGIKLFPTMAVIHAAGMNILHSGDFCDRCSHYCDGAIPTHVLGGINRYNHSRKSTFIAAFREAAKLTNWASSNGTDPVLSSRIMAWCTGDDGEHGDASIMGARMGVSMVSTVLSRGGDPMSYISHGYLDAMYDAITAP